MKTSVSPHMAAILLFSLIASLSAQNVPGASHAADDAAKSDLVEAKSERGFSSSQVAGGRYIISLVDKAKGELPAGKPAYVAQDSLTLDSRLSSPRPVESVVDLEVLRNPSPYRRIAVSIAGRPYEVAADGLQNGLAQISAVYREAGKISEQPDCGSLSLSVEQRVKLDVSKLLEVVESEVSANPGCACEIVKTAIKASEADVATVVSIVEAAINASPDNMRIVSQCAIAAMPESITEIQALLAKLDPNSGDADAYSSKSAKSAKSAKEIVAAADVTPNPLDLPPIYPPIIPLIFPPPVTNVNP